MTIKAIETRYKGYRFRSRLEARWAVFFDALGVAWEYEREGFCLDGLNYLPDFWLPDLEFFVEIKPDKPPEGDRSLEKIRRLGQGGRRVVMHVGDPWPWSYRCWIALAGLVLPFPTAQWATCGVCDKPSMVVSHRDGLNCSPSSVFPRPCSCSASMCWELPDTRPAQWTVLGKAYQAARSARFEHGETPS